MMLKECRMSHEEADKYIEDAVLHIHNTLAVKGKEYTRNDDRMHNFNVAARMRGITREQAIDGMRLKHETSVCDIRNDLATGIIPSVELVKEKFGDTINYYLLELMSVLHKIEHNGN
jgi:hypothetical protein